MGREALRLLHQWFTVQDTLREKPEDGLYREGFHIAAIKLGLEVSGLLDEDAPAPEDGEAPDRAAARRLTLAQLAAIAGQEGRAD